MSLLSRLSTTNPQVIDTALAPRRPQWVEKMRGLGYKFRVAVREISFMGKTKEYESCRNIEAYHPQGFGPIKAVDILFSNADMTDEEHMELMRFVVKALNGE